MLRLFFIYFLCRTQVNGSLKVETPTFALTLIAIVVMLTLLQFMPVLVLGPIADHLLLVQG